MRSIALGLLAALAFLDFVSAQENPRYSQSLECSKKADAKGSPHPSGWWS
jgi:hypothetical protein